MKEPSTLRKIETIIEPMPVVEGAGVLLKRSIATPRLDYVDPFLLFDHFGSDDPDDYMAGFPMHPHRGIETVTYMLAGAVQHKDSLGNVGVIETGDVQWMTAGGGIMHEEMPQEREGRMEGFQLWVNLPARLKMCRPRYQGVLAGEIPAAPLAGGGSARVIAGAVEGLGGLVQGPVQEIAADPTYLDVSLPAGSQATLPAPSGHTTLAYLFAGSASFDAHGPLEATRMLVFGEGEAVNAEAGKNGARFLLISGKPLGEPVARYGPFVMNTRQEILQALDDLRHGTFVYREK